LTDHHLVAFCKFSISFVTKMGAGCSTIAEEVIREIEQAQVNAMAQQYQPQQQNDLLEQHLRQAAVCALNVAVRMGQQQMEQRQQQQQLQQMQQILDGQHQQAQSQQWLAQQQAEQLVQAQQWLAHQQQRV
jgi:hypothetical protein